MTARLYDPGLPPDKRIEQRAILNAASNLPAKVYERRIPTREYICGVPSCRARYEHHATGRPPARCPDCVAANRSVHERRPDKRLITAAVQLVQILRSPGVASVSFKLSHQVFVHNECFVGDTLEEAVTHAVEKHPELLVPVVLDR